MGIENLFNRKEFTDGPKVTDLEADEKAQWDTFEIRRKELQRRSNELQMDVDELKLVIDRWWHKLRIKYKIELQNIRVIDSSIHEMVEKAS